MRGGGCRLDRTRTQSSAALAAKDEGLDDDDDPVTVELGHRDASALAAKEEGGHDCTQSDAAASHQFVRWPLYACLLSTHLSS